MNIQNYPSTFNNQYYIQNPQQITNPINFPNQPINQNIYNYNQFQGFNTNIIQKNNTTINNITSNLNSINNINNNSNNNLNKNNNINNIIDKEKKPKKSVKFIDKVDVLLVESYKDYNKIEEEELYNNYYSNNKVYTKSDKNCECNIL